MASHKAIAMTPRRMSRQSRSEMPEWLLRRQLSYSRPGAHVVDRKGPMPRPIKLGEKPQQSSSSEET